MKNPKQNRDWTRRRFLQGAGWLGVGSALTALSARPAQAARAKAGATLPQSAYDIDRFRKTDPALVHYEQAGAIACSRQEPKRIAVGPENHLFVTAGGYVMLLDQKGRREMEFAAREDVRCLTWSPESGLYVGLRDHIEVFDREGKRLEKWASPAEKAWLTGIAVGDKDVFVSDAGNRLVYRYDRSGKLLGRIGEKDKERNVPGFVVPSPYFDLEIGRDGRLWVANPGRHQIEAYTFEGRRESSWGQPSFGVTGFCGCCNPSCFALLSDGRFVTSEKGLARVKVYSATGEFESVVAGPEAFPKYFENLNSTPIPMDVAVDATGRVFVVDTLGNQIRIYQRKSPV